MKKFKLKKTAILRGFSLCCALFLCFALLGGCSSSTPDAPVEKTPDPVENVDTPPVVQDSLTFFTDGLPGEWVYSDAMYTDMICKMNITAEKKVTLTFVMQGEEQPVSEYHGDIVFQWTDSDQTVDVPDQLSFDLYDNAGEYIAGATCDLIFTLHDGMRVLGLTPVSAGETVFDQLEYESFMNFYRETGESPRGTARVGDDFLGAFWAIDHDAGIIWLEYVELSADGLEYICAGESIPYVMAADIVFDFEEADDLFVSAVYEVTTNDAGEVTYVTFPEMG